jgi:glutathione-specific gamma-glutamylcyclotransferase
MARIERKHLQQDAVRAAMRAAGHGHLLMADAAVDASLAQTMKLHPPKAPVWVFGYGSLVWAPLFHFSERRVARAFGVHRGFYLWSQVNRGTPETPGLVLALDRGGQCSGVTYRLEASTEEEDLRLLWRREMVLGAYRPRWLDVRTEVGLVRAIAFVVDRKHPGYSGRLTDDRVVSVALTAHGHYGACADYLVETADALTAHGIADRNLDRLARRVRAARR